MSDAKIPAGYDPVTLEVIRMRLDSIVEEMGIAMIRSSGSPVITEGGDFNTALFDAEGRIYAYSDFVQMHIGTGSMAVKLLMEAIEGEPLSPGDAFICNDPHSSGASHAPDTTVISPIFIGAKHVGWAHSQAHLVDVGGMNPGGFAPAATDCFSEAIRMPPGVKIYDRGEPVESVKRTILNNVRVPKLYWNDVRSLVASNNTGIRRLVETINEFGLDEFTRYTALNFELAERLVRTRITAIPDGVYRTSDFTEHNGHRDGAFEIACAMIVEGDSVTLDFEGSAPQTDGFVNCSYGALMGAIAAVIVPVLAWDVPFNEGVMSAFTVLAPRGSIVNPESPAPVSNGHLTTGSRVSRVVAKLFSQACMRSEDAVIQQRTQGQWADSWTGGIAAGVGADGEYFVFFNMDGSGSGAGAQPTGDGVDCAGLMTQINNVLPDVEMNEMLYPILYLWREVGPTTAGHGQFRGGMGLDFAWTLHGVDEAVQTVFAPIARIPAEGHGGGLPAGGSGHAILRGTNVESLRNSKAAVTKGTVLFESRDIPALNASGLKLSSGEVFHQWIAGGGGFGDPLLRDPEKVAKDVHDGYLAATIASQTYGVELGSTGAVDHGATAERRTSIRRDRIGREPQIANGEAGVSSAPVRRDGAWICPASGAVISEKDDWREDAIVKQDEAEGWLSDNGTQVRGGDGFISVTVEQFYSPVCGSLLDTRLAVTELAPH
ncbi:hydantoinase B/oxoprolinase family protein [Nesterenkonia haasae]|uniref:hydantoinase B/oxoprolinase family protein n=1 Tax=Nesterenkonia haasae TaxID=2587813 RepID=UPI001391F90C|nr:hydantoinase B/oxoprolinase family protein [Nesterenkonia haasae]NDK33118.1 hydantoinase B/oxoprolinase family protein [Nesterenkonia haasae]